MSHNAIVGYPSNAALRIALAEFLTEQGLRQRVEGTDTAHVDLERSRLN
jgi:hypothetical protein